MQPPLPPAPSGGARPFPVAIVGMACVFPGAADVGGYWANIEAGVDAISDVPPNRLDPAYFEGASGPGRLRVTRGGFVDHHAHFDAASFGVMPLAVDDAEPDQLLALRLAAEAVADAGGAEALGDPASVGVIVGRGGYLTSGTARLDQKTRVAQQVASVLGQLVPELGPQRIAEIRHAFEAEVGPERPEATIGLVPNLAASRIANRLDLQGPAYTVDAACASSLVAVDHAVRELASGRCSSVIVGGVHHCHDITFWSVFSQLGALSPSGTIAPFSRHADGLLIGEGSGMVVLQPLEDALAEGRHITAVICGTGVASDGRDSSLLRPRLDGQLLAVRRGWEAAGMDPAEAGLIEAHGTATVAGDTTELATLRSVFGDDGPPLALGSIKSMIGHLMPASGMAGLIKTALALQHRVLPPTLHADQPHDNLAGSRLKLLAEAEPWHTDGRRVAGLNAFGFGGINAHLVLREPAEGERATPGPVPAAALRDSVAATGGQGDAAAPRAADGSTVLVCSGPTPESVVEWLDQLSPGASAIRLEPGPVRLVILNPDERRLSLARRALTAGKPWRGRSDVWCVADGLGDGGGSTVWMYPGVEPSFAPQVGDVAELLGLAAPDVEVDAGGAPLGFQGAAIVHLGRFLTTVMARLGAAPDAMAGHSVGEWTAMAASGLIPPDELERLLAEIDPADLEVPGVQFVALGCDAQSASQLAAGLPDVALSHDNCPHQAILCGPEADVAVVVDRAKAGRVMAQVLPFTSGFHSPAFAPYLGQVSRHLDDMAVTTPGVPLWSATSTEPYPADEAAMKRLVKAHLVETVRFRELVERLYEHGARVFVQLGVGSLPSFVNDTLKGRPHVAVSAASEKRPGLEQLVRTVAALWAEGAEVDLALLGYDRASRPEDSAAQLRSPAGATGPLLQLGAPLVRLPDSLVASVRADLAVGGAAGAVTNGEHAAAGHPVLAQMQALTEEATLASRQVVEAFGSVGPPPTGARSPQPAPQPAGGRAGSGDGGTSTVEVSLDTMPWLVDHCFYRQPNAGLGSDMAERFPVVPMTEMIELMRAAATQRFPGTVAVAVSGVRALRWLPAAPPTTVTVTVGDLVDGQVKVALEGYARCTVHCAPRYPAPGPTTGPTPDEGPLEFDITVDDVYEGRMMFHGPSYQGITALTGLTTSTISGDIGVLDRTGAMLDSAGQLLGLWVMQRLERDVIILPQSIERVEYFGHRPAGPMACTVTMTDVNDKSVSADLELTDATGTWCRITGWVDRRFNSDDVLWPFLRFPDSQTVAQRQSGGWWLLLERWTDSASRELLVRRYTDADERSDYADRTPLAQRSWLLGRAVAKDAVRQHLWGCGGPPMFPVEVQIGHNAAGAPHVSAPPEAAGLHLSIAHSGRLGVAHLATDAPVGIDVERVVSRGEGFGAIAFTDAERDVLGDPAGEDFDVRLTAMWAAKEAAAKQAGTGLQGRPGDWEITQAIDDRLLVNDRWVNLEVVEVPLPPGADEATPEQYVVAWTASDPVAALDQPRNHPPDHPPQRSTT